MYIDVESFGLDLKKMQPGVWRLHLGCPVLIISLSSAYLMTNNNNYFTFEVRWSYIWIHTLIHTHTHTHTLKHICVWVSADLNVPYERKVQQQIEWRWTSVLCRKILIPFPVISGQGTHVCLCAWQMDKMCGRKTAIKPVKPPLSSQSICICQSCPW